MKNFVEVTVELNGKTQTVSIEKQRYEQIHKTGDRCVQGVHRPLPREATHHGDCQAR